MNAETFARPRACWRIEQSSRISRIAFAAGLSLAVGALFSQPTSSQSASSFTARLAWVPISGAERNDVAGRGQLTATLEGTILTISGEFEGLHTAAVIVRLHEGVALGARGPAIADLSVTPATEGQISGQVTLNASQLNALQDGRLYVQLHSHSGVAPDHSNLWGWLLP
jgi:hypothetical protein